LPDDQQVSFGSDPPGGGSPTSRTAARHNLRLVSTPQVTGLISFKQPLPLSIGLAPSGRLHLHPIAALA